MLTALMSLADMSAGPLAIDTSTTISVALLVVVLGAVWRLSSLLARIEMNLSRLKHTPAHLRHLDMHLMQQEEDLNNLWAAVRTDDPARLLDVTRRAKFIPFPDEAN